MNNLKLKLSIALFIATGSASAVTIDFDTDDYAIPGNRANGCWPWPRRKKPRMQSKHQHR